MLIKNMGKKTKIKSVKFTHTDTTLANNWINSFPSNSNGEVAMVKSTGEVMNINSKYSSVYFESKISFDIDEKTGKLTTEEKNLDRVGDISEVPGSYKDHYILSDGNDYSSEELIVGKDNIRDFNIDKMLDNGIS